MGNNVPTLRTVSDINSHWSEIQTTYAPVTGTFPLQKLFTPEFRSIHQTFADRTLQALDVAVKARLARTLTPAECRKPLDGLMLEIAKAIQTQVLLLCVSGTPMGVPYVMDRSSLTSLLTSLRNVSNIIGSSTLL